MDGPNLSKNYLETISCSPPRTSPHQLSMFIMSDIKYFSFLNLSTASFFLRSFSRMLQFVQFIDESLSILEHNFFILKFQCFNVSCSSLILLLPNIALQKDYLGLVSRYAQFFSFLLNISSISLALPALIVLRTLANFLEWFLKTFPSNSIIYLFP